MTEPFKDVGKKVGTDTLTCVADLNLGKRFAALKLDCNSSPNWSKLDDELKEKEELSEQVELRQNNYLNNIVEQDHRGIKRLVKPGMGSGSFNTALRTIKGYEIMNILQKGQVEKVRRGAVQERVKLIAEIFGVAN